MPQVCRRWYQFSLRTLLLASVAFAVLLAAYGPTLVEGIRQFFVRPEATPEDTLVEIARAVKQDNVEAFRRNVSRGTIEQLQRHYGEGQIEPSLRFMMSCMKSGLPFRAVGQQEDGDAVLLSVEGNDWEVQLVFIREGEQWRLDLTNDFQAWKELEEWAADILRKMERNTPFLGSEGPTKFP